MASRSEMSKERLEYVRKRDRESHARRYKSPETKEKHKLYVRKYRVENSDKVRLKQRKADLRNRYNMSYEDYENLLKKQDNKCAICDQVSVLVVDHCHATGKVRGLLCNNCNVSLGLLKDDKEIIKKALEYL